MRILLVTTIAAFNLFISQIGLNGFCQESMEEKEIGILSNPIIDSDMTFEQAIRKGCPPEVKKNLIITDVLYYSFDEKIHKGQVVIDKRLIEDIKEVFQVALREKFPITSVIPISHDRFFKDGKWNDDDLSMLANNTSAFNYRMVTGGKTLSKHAYGFAIDINPVQNPYIKGDVVLPPTAVYDVSKSGTLTPDCPVVKTFLRLGWTWGGYWETLKDYQHFEKIPEDHPDKDVIAQSANFALFKDYEVFLDKVPEAVKGYFYFKTDCNEKYAAITFDDGPTDNTKPLVALLKRKKIPAAFFVECGRLNAGNVRLYHDPLFEIGMHTFSHCDYRKLSRTQIIADVGLCVQRFESLALRPEYFRPAYGVINPDLADILSKRQIKGILWNIDSFDWRQYKGEELRKQAISSLCNGSIILFHDKIDINELEKIIKEIQIKGFKIVPLKTILKFKREYPGT